MTEGYDGGEGLKSILRRAFGKPAVAAALCGRLMRLCSSVLALLSRLAGSGSGGISTGGLGCTSRSGPNTKRTVPSFFPSPAISPCSSSGSTQAQALLPTIVRERSDSSTPRRWILSSNNVSCLNGIASAEEDCCRCEAWGRWDSRCAGVRGGEEGVLGELVVGVLVGAVFWTA